jgi:aminoglycoside phosphotransferase (APT) family kinase protein
MSEAAPQLVPPVESPAPTLAEFVESTGLASVLVGVSKDPNAKVTVLLVSRTTGRAVLAVKVPTTTAAAAVVAVERRTLEALPRRLPHDLLGSVPRTVQMVDANGLPALVTTAVPGAPMSRDYLGRPAAVRARAAEHFAAAGRWLEWLQTATAGARAPIEVATGAATALQARFEDDPHVGDDVARLAEVSARLREHAVPRTVVHGDLWFGNLLLDRGRITGVVDWEASSACGEPLRDVARFVVMYALYLDARTRPGRRVRGLDGLRAGDWGAGVAFAVDGTGWFPELFRGFVRGALDRLGAPPELWRSVILAGVAEVAAQTDDPAFARAHLRLLRRLL